MKLTSKVLKGLILEVVNEKKQKSMLLSESRTPKYDRIISALEGNDSDVRTVVIMSGQNPMAQGVATPEDRNFLAKLRSDIDPVTFKRQNERLSRELEASVSQFGYTYDKIGGVFGGLEEKSLLIYNIDQFTADKMCRRFKQWAFVWGEKYPMNRNHDFMAFKMLVVDYDQPMGWYIDPYSKQTGFVIKHQQLQNVDDNISLDPTSGKKFGLDLY